ncbi:hypothetical protein KUCAC02_000618 [Chaenocephalus aceratus]|uniref:Uncharacterized protein n=1 Tax=Chaenocephalus aceratus TaxID=36190 RepID=A0ACB9W7B9_CHAAC|nr:hypothetical protein KUCAC02_000618 [Chaenocephalus aceratus]
MSLSVPDCLAGEQESALNGFHGAGNERERGRSLETNASRVPGPSGGTRQLEERPGGEIYPCRRSASSTITGASSPNRPVGEDCARPQT